MAEQEVIKHFKKSISVWSNDNYTLIKKVNEFLLEIFIIVFAISISIWLHSWEKKHEDHKKVQDFYNNANNGLLFQCGGTGPPSTGSSIVPVYTASQSFLNPRNIGSGNSVRCN